MIGEGDWRLFGAHWQSADGPGQRAEAVNSRRWRCSAGEREFDRSIAELLQHRPRPRTPTSALASYPRQVVDFDRIVSLPASWMT